MSTLKTTYIQHPSAEAPAIELNADGTVTIAGASSDETIALILALGG